MGQKPKKDKECHLKLVISHGLKSIGLFGRGKGGDESSYRPRGTLLNLFFVSWARVEAEGRGLNRGIEHELWVGT